MKNCHYVLNMFSFMRSVWKANNVVHTQHIEPCWFSKLSLKRDEYSQGRWCLINWKEKDMFWDWINIWTSSIRAADRQGLPPLCGLLTLHKSQPETHLEMNSSSIRPQSARGWGPQNRPHVVHQLTLDRLFFNLHASRHMSLHLIQSPGRLLCIVSN